MMIQLTRRVAVFCLALSVFLAQPAASDITPPPADLSNESFVVAFQTLCDHYRLHYPFSAHKGVDWPGLIDSYLPQVAAAQAAQDSGAFQMIIRNFVHSFPDGHVRVSGEFRDLYIPEIGGGFGLTLIELADGTFAASRVRPGSPAALAGMQRGVTVTEWAGQAMAAAVAGADIVWEGQPPATQAGRQLARLRRLVRAPVGTPTAVSFSNPGSPATTEILTAVDDTLATWDQSRFTIFGTDGRPEFDPYDLFHPVQYEVTPAGYGYLRNTILIEVDEYGNITGSFDNIMAELSAAVEAFNAAQVSGVIVDLRGNPGGYDALASFFGGLFYDHAEVYEHASFYDADAGDFVVLPDFTLHLEPQAAYYGGPVVCLVDAGTASSAEGVAMAIQRLPQGLVVGVQGTHGSFGLTGGETLMPCGLAVSFPLGRSLDADMQIQLDSDSGLRGGVVPDWYVRIDSQAVEDLFGSNQDIVLADAERLLDNISAAGSPGRPVAAGARLLSCYPNPFNPQTTIAFEMPLTAPVGLKIHDLAGRLVRTLINNELARQGRNEISWNGRDDQGRRVPTGTYFYRLEAGEFTQTRKMMLLK